MVLALIFTSTFTLSLAYDPVSFEHVFAAWSFGICFFLPILFISLFVLDHLWTSSAIYFFFFDLIPGLFIFFHLPLPGHHVYLLVSLRFRPLLGL